MNDGVDRSGGTWSDVPAGLLAARADGTVVDVNDTLLAWTGRERADVVGRVRVGDLLTVGGRLYWETHLAPLLFVEGRLDEIALELKGSGERLPVLLTAERGPDGLARMALVVARERARFDRELLEANAASTRTAADLTALLDVTSAVSRANGVDGVAQALLGWARARPGVGTAELWLDESDRGTATRSTPPAGLVPGGRAAVSHEGRIVVPAHGLTRLQAVLVLVPEARPGVTGPDLTGPDLTLLTTVGEHVGLALDRAWLNERRAGIAHELQRSLLAAEPPSDPRFAVAALYRPGVEALDVGGDWHDVFRSDLEGASAISFTVGDVVGRGLHAAVAMGQLRSAVRALSGSGAGPAVVLTALDGFAEQVADAQCATVALAALDLDTGEVRYACAGHLPPVHLPAAGGADLWWDGRSTPLTIVAPGLVREEGRARLAPGDCLLLYTDGLVERRHRSLDDGLAALAVAAAGARGLPLPQVVEQVARDLLADEDSRDDVCLLLVQWLGPA